MAEAHASEQYLLFCSKGAGQKFQAFTSNRQGSLTWKSSHSPERVVELSAHFFSQRVKAILTAFYSISGKRPNLFRIPSLIMI